MLIVVITNFRTIHDLGLPADCMRLEESLHPVSGPSAGWVPSRSVTINKRVNGEGTKSYIKSKWILEF